MALVYFLFVNGPCHFKRSTPPLVTFSHDRRNIFHGLSYYKATNTFLNSLTTTLKPKLNLR